MGSINALSLRFLGLSLNHIRELHPAHVVYPSTVKRVINQLLLGLEYLHEVCNIVHAGWC
jgi:serine/threonine-protein kinase SRPK3